MDYKDMLNVIGNIEKNAAKVEASTIDITPIMNSSQAQNVSYSELLQKLSKVESKEYEKHIIREKPKPAHIITAGLEQAAYSQPQVYAPARQAEGQAAARQVQPALRQQAVQPPSEAEARRAKIELGSIVKKLGSAAKLPQFRVKHVNASELVLPNLTLADQIAELERIIEGLKEGVFDMEHMEIVKEEVYGLSEIVGEMKKKGAQPAKSELEKSLFDLRDQRLSDAVALLKMSS
ncbi:MAG: hypothetical protein QXW10_01850 [Candidatus Micrarchaeaceae archaeon]